VASIRANVMLRGEKFITIKDLMEILNVSRPTAYRMVYQGHFHAAKFAGCLRVSLLSVEAFINRQMEAFHYENGIASDE
jgi:excisionase family DNA binding protein